ncbi:MAG: hypothetical protein ACKN9V_09200 [Pseudomonadota bacterium]
MIWLLLTFPFIVLADVSERCRDFGEQIDKHLSNQKKFEVKKEELEEKLRVVLQNEIAAQVEMRDASAEEGEATSVYYELRKSRMESERWEKVVKAHRESHCDPCEKEAGWSKSNSELCRRCPGLKACFEKGSP